MLPVANHPSWNRVSTVKFAIRVAATTSSETSVNHLSNVFKMFSASDFEYVAWNCPSETLLLVVSPLHPTEVS